MRLIALQAIPGGMHIPAGAEFEEPNEEQAKLWMNSGMAKPKHPLPVPEQKLPKLNSRGWDGLFWDKGQVVIIASGESLTEEQCEAARQWQMRAPNRYAIAINTSFRRALWADVLYACDGQWWKTVDPKTGLSYYAEAVSCFGGELWTQDQVVAKEYNLRYIASRKGNGLSRHPAFIFQGNNSGYQAMNLAYLAGVEQITLLGFDCKGGHWHGDHPPPVNARLPHSTWIANFKALAADFRAAGIEVRNASPGSALRCFPQMKWEAAFEG